MKSPVMAREGVEVLSPRRLMHVVYFLVVM